MVIRTGSRNTKYAKCSKFPLEEWSKTGVVKLLLASPEATQVNLIPIE